MSPASISDGQVQPGRTREPATKRWSKLADGALYFVLAVLTVAGLLQIYGSHLSLHHDLAGSALSGRLAVTLGDHFRNYMVYFPQVERVWFSLAAKLADGTGIRLDLIVVLMTAAATLFATGLAYWIRRKTTGPSPLFLVLSVAALAILPIVFKNVFGLREHLVALGLWPYLVLRISDPDGTRIGRPLRLLVGLWMGATLLFKYLYSVVVLLVEVADALVQRRPLLLFRIENIVAGVVVGIYLFDWLILDASQRAVIGAMLSSIDANLADPAKNWWQVIKNLSFAAFFLLAFRVFGLPRREMAIGFAVLLGAIIAAFAQERWYSHHLFPVMLAYLAWWWMVAPGFKPWGHAVLALCMSVTLATQVLKMDTYGIEIDELEHAVDAAGQSVTGKRVGVLTMHPSPINQYLVSHRALRWNAMMNNAYVSAELKPFDRPENAGVAPPPVKLDDPGRRMLHDEMLRLWEDMPPDVLILDHSTRWPLKYIDVRWRHVFSQDPRFNAILARYRPVLTHKGERLEFIYYVRAD